MSTKDSVAWPATSATLRLCIHIGAESSTLASISLQVAQALPAGRGAPWVDDTRRVHPSGGERRHLIEVWLLHRIVEPVEK
jgi:hypothetical protein